MDDLDLGATIRGFSPGQRVFGRYTLKRILGRGGMGVVWLAHDDKLDREVALKFLPEVVAADPRAIDDLKRETRRSLELTHPHIVRIYDFIDDAHTAAIAMEYVAGDTLAKLALDQPDRVVTVEQLTPWAKQLCDALDYAHTKASVVHRDLKPANLMIDARGDLKVADFGIAASVSDSVSRVSAQAGSSGTPVYMSPQQMMGEKPAVTDDIYALGATLYDLLTGKPPFHSGNIILQVQNKVPPSIAERRAELNVRNTNIPSEWEETIAACLTKEAEDRPQSVREVWSRLETPKDTKALEPTEHTENTEGKKVGRDLRSAPGLNEVERLVPQTLKAQTKDVSGTSRPTKKKPLVIGLVAGLCVLAFAGYYFGIHVPEQKRLAEVARLETEARLAADAKERARLEAERVTHEKAAVARLSPEQEKPDAQEVRNDGNGKTRKESPSDGPLVAQRNPAVEPLGSGPIIPLEGQQTSLPTDHDPLTWTAPVHWIAKEHGALRKGSYDIPGHDGSVADLSITAFPGDAGGMLANMNRWRKQISLPPHVVGELDALTKDFEAGSLCVRMVDFVGNVDDMPTRIIGAVIIHGAYTWFFKLMGPDALVTKERAIFEEFIRTVRPRLEHSQQLSDAELLGGIARSLRPSGSYMVGGEPYLLFGQKRLKVGDSLTVSFEGREYTLHLTAIDRNSFTLRYNGEEVTRLFKSPVESPMLQPEGSEVQASSEFRAWVENLSVAGVRTGTNPRFSADGKAYNVGDTVQPVLGIVFVGLDGSSPGGLLVFKDRRGAILKKAY